MIVPIFPVDPISLSTERAVWKVNDCIDIRSGLGTGLAVAIAAGSDGAKKSIGW
jgi:hypothetical protein